MQLLVVGRSPLLTGVQRLAAGITLATALWLAMSGHGLAGCAATLAAACAWRVRHRSGQLRLRSDGICETDAGVETLVAGAFSGAGWIVLRLAGRARSEVLVLAPDSASAEELRQVRVWLKWALPRGN
jgi:hypothetical protein